MAKAKKDAGPAEAGTPNSGGTITAAQLCAITGLTDRRHRQLAQGGYFPPPINGVYQAKCLLGIIKYQRELIAKKSDVLRKEQEAYTRAKREMAQEELAQFRGKYVLKDEIGPALRNVSLHQRAVLCRVLEQEMGPNLVGKTTIEVMARVREAVDQVCGIFREQTGKWVEGAPVGAEEGKKK